MVDAFGRGNMLGVGQTLPSDAHIQYSQDVSVRINALEEQIKARDKRIMDLLGVIKVLAKEIKHG